MSVNYENLIKAVLSKSKSKEWRSAVMEWSVFDCEEDPTQAKKCICGKEGLYYLFTIKNDINGNTLFPIGSTCIKKFDRDDLYTEASLWEQEFKLYHAIEDGKFITLKNGFFTRKLLKKLYDDGAFKATEFNGFDPHSDYEFLLEMFNKRKEITDRQNRKCIAIILGSIKPFIKSRLKYYGKNAEGQHGLKQ